VPRVNFVTSGYRIYLRVLRWLGRLIRTGARTLNGSGACAFYKLQLTRTNTRDKETKERRRQKHPPLWKTISPRDIYGRRHPRGYGNRGKQRRNRWVAAFPSCGISRTSFLARRRRSVAQIIVSCASRRRKWNFVIAPQQRRVPFLFLRSWAKIFNHWIKGSASDGLSEESSLFHGATFNRRPIVIDSNHYYHSKHQIRRSRTIRICRIKRTRIEDAISERALECGAPKDATISTAALSEHWQNGEEEMSNGGSMLRETSRASGALGGSATRY